MKFKAKPKLTPERLKVRLNKAEGNKCALKFKTVNIEINNGPSYFDVDEILSLVRMVNSAPLPEKKSKAKLELHCDADFY